MAKANGKSKSNGKKAADELQAVTGSQADYDAFAAEAAAIPKAEIVPMRADPQLALHNVEEGAKAVLAEKARLAKLPETNVAELGAIARLALAVVFADTQVEPAQSATGARGLLGRGLGVRRVLLPAAKSLVAAGLLPADKVARIEKGTGPIDVARDCVDLAALFRKNAAKVKGRHPVTAAQITEAETVGTELLRVLKPARAKPAKTAAALGQEDRDRMWTLLVRRHDALWRAGAYLFGRAVDEKVPSLQAGRGGRGNRQATAPAGKTTTAPA